VGLVVPIESLLRDGHFTSEDITVLTAAFEDTLRGLKLVNRQDPAVSMVAERIIELARRGQRDPDVLRDAVLNSFRSDPGFSGL
jgi:hypothetical protein